MQKTTVRGRLILNVSHVNFHKKNLKLILDFQNLFGQPLHKTAWGSKILRDCCQSANHFKLFLISQLRRSPTRHLILQVNAISMHSFNSAF